LDQPWLKSAVRTDDNQGDDESRHERANTLKLEVRMLGSFLIKWLSQRSVPPNRGALGEGVAERYLVRTARMKLVVRNWRNPKDRREEIDLVMRDGDVLVFVEVKTRTAGALVPGYNAVNQHKKRVLTRGTLAYLRGMKDPPRTHRFDVLEVAWPREGEAGEPAVRHLANVPLKRRR
jgi:putative endonuclease